MALERTCDHCGKPSPKVVAKIFIGPNLGGHYGYTASADIGPCCIEEVNAMFAWKRRQTRGKQG